MFEVCFRYDEQMGLWDVFVKGATSELEALQGFNAAIITARNATPVVAANKATMLDNGEYKISVGV